MPNRIDALFVTGATGLIGSRALAGLLRDAPEMHAFVLVRSIPGWNKLARAQRIPVERVTAFEGDITREGLGLDSSARRALASRVRIVLHCAADTVFSRPLEDARRVNTGGTRHLLELAETWPGLERFVQVSTAFVVGKSVGRMLEHACEPSPDFVNYYEQSKLEAERLVRAFSRPWVILRPSTVVCDSAEGTVSQLNAVHRALRLCHSGLAPMLPGEASNRVDVVTTEYVADCVSTLTVAPGVESGTFHLCAGDNAIELGTLLDTSYAVWSESDRWRRRAISMPALTDLETYRLFERTVEETANARLRAITKSLSHFVPQLALPKRFDTSETERVMERPAPPVAEFWEPMVRHLISSRWAAAARRAA